MSASSDSNRPEGNSSSGATPPAPEFTPDPTALAHLELILNGAYPLAGFMTSEESASVVKHGQLPDGTPWPIPVTLPVPDELAGAERVILTDPEGAPLAELSVSERWWSDPAGRQDAGDGLRLAGEIHICRPPMHGALRRMRLAPSDVRGQREIGGYADRPLLVVVTGRPLHHSVLHQIRTAAEDVGDSRRAEVLVLMDVPLDGEGMAPAILAAESLLPSRTRFVAVTLPKNAAGDSALPPGRDDLLAAHVARAYSATHVFVPRPAGQSDPEVDGAPIPVVRPSQWRYDARENLWRPADQVDPERAEPEPGDTEVEELLALGRELPAWFTPPRVAAELAKLRPPRTQRGVTVFLTGLSGSGKSTVARGVAEGIRRSGRSVTLLDGDVVRRLLSAGLTFSKEDRDLNIRRIGYVAAEITRHGGVAICAPIAPYAATRAQVREMVEEAGDFFLVHVATPLEVCEARDRKGLYAKARAGEIPEFTGVSDPYEVPADADLELNTDGSAEEESVAEVLAALRAGGWLGSERH
ncbi:sulfate adenylyltransferase [Lipingzhangella halophila]|uniref:Adenylyl-sulfate kinase n=1 Tax=Lipingzhangella halophila TaxID=1783352 RepID=A0A7W7W1I8_9ACTN|nr:adenylyl-sulfate kinase [Lipingzhangella halophila]MBB4929730.1 sulfate adenylyltransferase [Lipingzhangella halophila]